MRTAGFPLPKSDDLDCIKIMTDTIKKYKTVPKQQEIISNSMFHYIAYLACHASNNSLFRAITNWIILRCYMGFHNSEWCSDYNTIFKTFNTPMG